MRVYFQYPSVLEQNYLGNISFTYNGEEYCKRIVLGLRELFKYFNDKNSKVFDLLIISAVIYNLDKFLERKRFSIEGWTREISVNIPVFNLEIWNENKANLVKAINFLSGDLWNITFEQSQMRFKYRYSRRNRYRCLQRIRDISKFTLFSGGMDSLIGMIDLIHNNPDDKLCLISHYDSGKERTDQDAIKSLLENYNNYFNFQIKCGFGKINKSKNTEQSTRSRSLIFLGIGIYITNNLNTQAELIIPENGTISLNYPLSPSRRGSCSTRTTHPTFIKYMNELLVSLGLENRIINPYQFKTKGEMIRDCSDNTLFNTLWQSSNSCGKRAHKYYWAVRSASHCGYCMPCIYRKIALHFSEINNTDNYGNSIFNLAMDQLIESDSGKFNDLKALLNFLKGNPNTSLIKQELISNGLFVDENINDYADIIVRTMRQARYWINDEANESIKDNLIND
ncbi:MAG: hypothetical protein KAT68_18195 [Bacteroidales bacterium]|nr:hypothetical protein [Bacteroidales bacterium]